MILLTIAWKRHRQRNSGEKLTVPANMAPSIRIEVRSCVRACLPHTEFFICKAAEAATARPLDNDTSQTMPSFATAQTSFYEPPCQPTARIHIKIRFFMMMSKKNVLKNPAKTSNEAAICWTNCFATDDDWMQREVWFSSHFWVSISSSFWKFTILNFNLAD